MSHAVITPPTAKPLSSWKPFWAKRFGPAPFLPMSRAEMEQLGWDSCDIVMVTGDAYVDHPSFGTGPAAVGSPQCYATRYKRIASGISYTVANEVNGVVDIGPGLVVKNSAGTTTVGNVHTIIFDSQLADFLVTGDGDGTATISQAGLTVTKTVVTNVTCDDGVLQVYRETWVFRRGRLSLVV